MKITLEIDYKHAAMVDDPVGETKRILNKFLRCVDEGYMTRTLQYEVNEPETYSDDAILDLNFLDSNGNTTANAKVFH